MIAPAVVLIFTFGIFPVFFALYVSLQKWRIKRGDFIGLANYEKAIGNLIYIVLFGLSIAAFVAIYVIINRVIQTASEYEENPWVFIIPGFFHAAAALAFLRWIIILLPEVLAIADKIIGLEKTRSLFLDLLEDAFTTEMVLSAWRALIILAVIALTVGLLTGRLKSEPRNIYYQSNFGLAWFTGAIGVILGYFTYQSVANQYQLALETGVDPGSLENMEHSIKPNKQPGFLVSSFCRIGVNGWRLVDDQRNSSITRCWR